MTIAPHAIIGAAAGTLTDNLWLVFLLGLISHFIGDFAPHLEPNSLVTKNPDGTKTWSPWLFVFIILEFLVTFFFLFLCRHRPDFKPILVGAFGGLLPDFIVNNPFLQKTRTLPGFKQIFWFHDTIHTELPVKLWPVSLLSEIILVGGALWYLLKFWF